MSRCLIVILSIFLAVSMAANAAKHFAPKRMTGEWVRLPGHVLPALAQAKRLESGEATKPDEPLTLTVVLKRDDQAGFERYLHDVYDPKSKSYRKFLSQKEMSEKFGPSQNAYDLVLGYLKKTGFELVEGAKNRMTLTIKGRKIAVEEAFNLHIGDYKLGDRYFRANDRDPGLPIDIAYRVESIAGLSNLAVPKPSVATLSCLALITTVVLVPEEIFIPGVAAVIATNCYLAFDLAYTGAFHHSFFPSKAFKVASVQTAPLVNASGLGQKIGLLEFDSFQTSDIRDYLNFIGSPPSQINNLSQIHVNGGAQAGGNQAEVLLDIDTVMRIAPEAEVVVYDAPFNGTIGSYAALFNAMINDGVTIISNSWSSCEDQISLADAQSIDTILQNAAAAGISVFNASGDSGNTCLDGSPNTVGVPADSPHATAVGGTSLLFGPGLTYGSETWWNGISDTPPSGSGGFGLSKFFAKPTYQNGINNFTKRSVPDVAVNADPAIGSVICQASAGGCPTGLLYGGTSVAAPVWAAFTALLNQAQGNNLGAINPLLYPLANTKAFYDAESMGSDFAHVGLGSPNLNVLNRLLNGQIVGMADASQSRVIPLAQSSNFIAGVNETPADGTTVAGIKIQLLDVNGNAVEGKIIVLDATSGSHATITPLSGGLTAVDGTVVFTITDAIAETLTLTATDVTDGVVLDEKPNITFGVPPVANAGFNAFPTSVTADGVSTTTITLTLQDALGRPTPGKLIKLEQTGHSLITGPIPPVTDSNGQIQFIAVDQMPETVTYTATDVSDGDLAFPGSGTVTFSNGIANGCGNGNPIAAPGLIATPYATGFVAQNYSFGNVNFGGCPGAFGMAFDGSGNLYVGHGPTGNIYKFPPGGGVADNSTLLTPTPIGPSLGSLVIDPNGNLFAGRSATGSNFDTGVVLQIDPNSGSVLRTIASGLTCSGFIARDPLSGDLFTDDSCGGAGSDNPSIWRITDPAGASPVTSVYATTSGTPNATLSFAPGGSLYVWTVTPAGFQVARVSGTNGPATPTIDLVPDLLDYHVGLLAGGMQPNGDADYLFFNYPAADDAPGGIGIADLHAVPPSVSAKLTTEGGTAGNLIMGPDACVYAAIGTGVFRITDETGACHYAGTPPEPTLALDVTGSAPAPAQGSTQSFTASLHYADVPETTPVFFTVTGANSQVKMVRTDANGKAAFDYSAAHAGKDTIMASTTVNDAALLSNRVSINWNEGKHVTFLSLNSSTAGGTLSRQSTVTATLTDVSAQPPVAVANELVDFTLGNRNCSAQTDAAGLVSCTIIPLQTGMETLTAHFAGDDQFVAADASIGFSVSKRVSTRGRSEALDGRQPFSHRLQPCRLRHPIHCKE